MRRVNDDGGAWCISGLRIKEGILYWSYYANVINPYENKLSLMRT